MIDADSEVINLEINNGYESEHSECSHYLGAIEACGPDRDCLQCLIDIDIEGAHECHPINTSSTVILPEVELTNEEPVNIRSRRASLEL